MSSRSPAAIKIEARKRRVVVHAYEQVLDACARLAAFATGHPLDGDGPISARQTTLALDDLVGFAIHARRLIESTETTPLFKDVSIVCGAKAKKIEMPLLSIINVLLHHQEMEVIRTEFERWLLTGADFDELEPFMRRGAPRLTFPPQVVVHSGRQGYMAFSITDLVETFETKVWQL